MERISILDNFKNDIKDSIDQFMDLFFMEKETLVMLTDLFSEEGGLELLND